MHLPKRTLLASVIALTTALFADNMLKNINFADADGIGHPKGWMRLSGDSAAKNGAAVLVPDAKGRAVYTQKVTIPLDTPLRIIAKAKAPVGTKWRVYVESYGQKLAPGKWDHYFSSGAIWHNGTGEMQEFTRDLMQKFPYSIAQFVLGIEGPGEVEFHSINLDQAPPPPILENADFSDRTDTAAKGWGNHGATLTFGKNDADVTLAPIEGKPTRIIHGLTLPRDGSPVLITGEGKAAPGVNWRPYTEWYEPGEVYRIAGNTWHIGNGEWEPFSYIISPVEKSTRCIIVLVCKGEEVSFRKLNAKPMKVTRLLGGRLSVPPPHSEEEEGVIILNGREGGAVINSIPVEPGKSYRIRYSAVGLGASGSITGFHEIRTKITPAVEGSFTFNDVWSSTPQAKFQDFTVPADSDIHTIKLSLSLNTQGKVRFCDFSIEERKLNPADNWRLRFTSPAYRETLFASDKDQSVAGVLLAPEGKDATVSLTRPDGTVQRQEITFSEGRAEFRFDPWNDFGTATLTAAIRGTDATLFRTFKSTIHKLAPLPHEVKIRPDRIVTFDGKPWFPIMKWGDVPQTEQALYWLARHGFNTMKTNFSVSPEKMLLRLDMAHRHGVKIVINSACPRSTAEIEPWLKRTKTLYTPEILAHPAFFGHFLIDEPLWGGVPVEPLRVAYAHLREIDPGHPVWLNLAPRNEVADLRPYGEACDIIGVDIYPVPWPNGHSGLTDKTPTSCGKYALRLADIVHGEKPVWNALQGFSWQDISNDKFNPNMKRIYPSLMVSRFMAFDTILNGGTGYSLWGSYSILTPSFWDTLLAVTGELHTLTPLFTNGRQLEDLQTSSADIRAVPIECDGNRYYFILNLTDKEIQGSVNLTENGLVEFISGKPVDLSSLTLEPYCAIVCGAKPLPPPLYPLPERNEAFDREGEPFSAFISKSWEQTKYEQYLGKASWIWDADSLNSGAHCLVYRSFDVDDPAKGGRLRVAADDAHTVYLNGQKIGEDMGWGKMGEYNLMPYLRKGTNTIVVHALDMGALPCGVLAELTIDQTMILSDTTWKTMPYSEKETELPSDEVLSKGKPAKVVSPYGEGAWGRNVRIYKKD